MADSHGWRIYRRSLCFLLGKAVKDLYPDAIFSVEHSFGLGLYASFHPTSVDDDGITARQLQKLNERMHDLVKSDIPIERHKISFADAVAQFEASGQDDKLNLLKYRNPPRVVIHACEGFSDLAHGPLAPTTGVLSLFELILHKPGFVLHLPNRTEPSRLPPFQDQPHLFRIFQEHKDWGRILGVNTVGRLNEIIANNEIDNFVRIAEALHEKKVARIADSIAAARDRIRLILVAGPSSAGKTTFSKRLATHLRVNGLSSVTLSTDNYFVGLDKNPRDENGEPDFEHIEAVDLELFNGHLLQLIKGKEIEIPSFNFAAKQREYHGTRLRIEPGQMIIIEGIHGLNPRLTEEVPSEVEFRVFVSALTQLSVDSNNRISTTDNRLMRRIVRDNMFRGHSALFTLQLWPSVRRGEKKWIYPFQSEAHATFNSALDYELAVLKPFVEPLLMQVKPDSPEYAETRRLSEFLLNFLGTSDRPVPGTSILREYIGGSMFDY
jgi:uridine kinase